MASQNKYPKDRNEVGLVNLGLIQSALILQGAKPAASGFNPQLQFILSNRYYAEAALAAINEGGVEVAHIMPTGMGGFSFEIQCAREAVTRIRSAYDRECDQRGLF